MRLVGRYQLQERIGQGAMADVYRAFDPEIGRPLAIKLLKPEFRQSRECCARFLREARAAGALSHPGIVTIHDVGEADGDPYIAMELLDGEPLEDLLKRSGGLPSDQVVALGLQLAEALAYAHGLGVVHRDVKPSNVMVSPSGRTVKLLDFGIARVVEADPIRAEAENLKTQVGQVIGTPRYMSPEQAQGLPLDGRSDLFSLGVVLYEMTTGRVAFAGSSAATLALQITINEPEPVRALCPTCPRGVIFIVEKLMAKRPDKRFADGRQLVEALRRELAHVAAVLAEGGQRARRLPLQARLTLVMTTVTAAALVIGVGTMLSRQYAAMERVALTSGSTIAAFVASNAGLSAVENATLPPEQRDWAPIAAFVQSATRDAAVRAIAVVDADGIIRGASESTLVGTRYRAPDNEERIRSTPEEQVSRVRLSDGAGGFRFTRPILYARRPFGTVDVSLSNAELDRTAQVSRLLLAALGLLILAVVAMTSFLVARALASPIRRLRDGLDAVARGNIDVRISHRRSDEFGELFDRFNLLAGAVEERVNNRAGDAEACATHIAAPSAEAVRVQQLRRRVA